MKYTAHVTQHRKRTKMQIIADVLQYDKFSKKNAQSPFTDLFKRLSSQLRQLTIAHKFQLIFLFQSSELDEHDNMNGVGKLKTKYYYELQKRKALH